MIIGIDVGSLITKYVYGKGENQRGNFKSTIVYGFEDYSTGIKTEYLGKQYILGTTKGKTFSLLNSVGQFEAELFLYTGIALAMKEQGIKETTIDLIVGLPSGKFKANKKALKESLLKQVIEIKLGKQTYKFTINNVLVMPQGSGLFLVEDLVGEGLIIDIGGITWDVTPYSFNEPDLKNAKSYNIGMQTFNGDLVAAINALPEGNNYEPYRADEVMNSKSIVVNSKDVPFDPSEVAIKYLNNGIENYVKNDFKNYTNLKKKWIGGGAIRLQEYITEGEVKAAPEDIYINANIYYETGVKKYA